MKKLLVALSATTLLLTNAAFAQGTMPKKHDPKFHQAISECMANAGIQKPEFAKDNNANTDKAPKMTERLEPPKDANGNPLPPKHRDGKGWHAKSKEHLTQEQRQKIDACMSKKGFEKPKKNGQNNQQQ